MHSVVPRLLPTRALASAACCVLLCGLWGLSWGRSLYVRYSKSSSDWTAVARCDDGVVMGIWWEPTGSGVPGLDGGVVRSLVGDVRFEASITLAPIGHQLHAHAIVDHQQILAVGLPLVGILRALRHSHGA